MKQTDMKILVLDIETTPHLVYCWGLFKQNIGINQIVEPTKLLSWAAKWVGEKKVYYNDMEDEDYIFDIWELIDEADAVVHYNGTAFDMKHLNREFIEVGLPPPLMPKNIDLLKTVKERFRFASNKLAWVARELLDKGKIEHPGFPLWWGCMNGDDKMWQLMKKYNVEDVKLTEELYLKIRGWIKGHPNHGLYVENQDKPVCRNCGSTNIHARGWQRLNVQSYQRYKCNDCGANLRGRQRVQGGKEAKQVLV